MNLLLCPGVYPPYQRAGSEIYLHKIAKYLQSVGHDVRCIARAPSGRYNYDGIDVYPQNLDNWKSDNTYLWAWAELVFCQLSGTYYVMNKMRVHEKKVINVAHNNGAYAQIPLRRNVYTIYNCHNTAKELNYNHDSIACPPPVFREHFANVDRTNAEYITLVNHNENKGGKILIEIAKRMPEYKFLAVHGGYYEQIKDESVKNIKYVPMVEDIRDILSQTRIMIAPSEYESYGQSQVEAMCCGIPVIATDLPGFREALRIGANYVKDRNSIDEWIENIKQIEEVYNMASSCARGVPMNLQPEKDLANLNIWLEKINNLAYK